MAAYPAPRFTISDEQAAFARQLAELLPAQGEWSEAEYLWLTNRTNRLVEFSAGYVEVLPMPTPGHQRIVAFLYGVMLAFITSRSLGTLLFAPLRVYLQPGKWREPDLVFLLTENMNREAEHGFIGADLVVEVVSPDDPQRDLVTKRREYAEAGIAEYWIVNPLTETITVLRLEQDGYAEHGTFGQGEVATSVLLAGLTVDVRATFAA
ncbi:MAG: Uma2 family endonuclease [Chloroflexaceae bacterium]